MPWQEWSPVNLRMQFVTEWQSGCWTMTELCADYQISRKTGYKWVERFDASGPRGLHDQSRRPHHSPHATDPRAGRGVGRVAAAASALGCDETADRRGARRSPRGLAEPLDGVRPSQARGLVVPPRRRQRPRTPRRPVGADHARQ